MNSTGNGNGSHTGSSRKAAVKWALQELGIPRERYQDAVPALQEFADLYVGAHQNGHTNGQVKVETLADYYGLVNEPEEPYDWAVPGLLERTDRIIVTAIEGAGKSELFRQLGVQMAAGVHPFTYERIDPLRVLYLDLENNRRLIRRKLNKLRPLAEIAGLQPEMFWPLSRAEGLDLVGSAADRRWLEGILSVVRPEVFFIGPMYKMANGPMQDEENVALPLSRYLDEIRTRWSTALLLEAHRPLPPSGSNSRPRRPYGAVWMRWVELGLCLDADGPLHHWRLPRDERDWPGSLARGGEGQWPWIDGALEIDDGDDHHAPTVKGWTIEGWLADHPEHAGLPGLLVSRDKAVTIGLTGHQWNLVNKYLREQNVVSDVDD